MFVHEIPEQSLFCGSIPESNSSFPWFVSANFPGKKNDFHFSWCHTIPSEHDAVIEIYEDVPTCSNNLKMALSENRAPY